MSELIAYGSEINNVFQLIGKNENDITKSIAWAINKCPSFADELIKKLIKIEEYGEITIKYQEYEKDRGITDLEIFDNNTFHLIIEAKRGWILPSSEQIEMYSLRRSFVEDKAKHKAIVTMSECSEEYANIYLPLKEANNIPVKHISWKRIYDIASQSVKVSRNSEKTLLRELMSYLGGLTSMQNQTSNWVYVVSLSRGKAGGNLSFLDIVNKKGIYYHPVGGNGWPKEPVNYIAFRYDGKLQSIHHVEKYTITKNMHKIIKEMPDEEWEQDHFVYTLGPVIEPTKEVKTGNIYASGRRWAMLDALLTSETIEQACNISKRRMEESE
ncbi:PD-(D/E)XK nuclease superfamily protein [Lachnospiraceae bacterium G41]|nr:PD-(D/E)XK nuclease superfamily protein [Lachnospiraceae bacterium G41]